MSEHICPVCGYPDLDEPAYYENGAPNYDICSACGFQSGYHDDGVWFNEPEIRDIHKKYRDKWIAGGMKFKHTKYIPTNWDPVRQLLNIGIIIKK
jgi:hypothetical protein